MDDIIIQNTLNLEELEKQKSIYDTLTLRERRISDDKSIDKYGSDNVQRYNMMKAAILIDKDPSEGELPATSVSESTDTENGEYDDSNYKTADKYSDEWLNKLELARIAESEGMVIVIVYEERPDPNSITSLKQKWDKFNSLDADRRNLSNMRAIGIFGVDNDALYHKELNKYKEMLNDDVKIITPDELNDYRDTLNLEAASNPFSINRYIKALDLEVNLRGSSSLYESVIMEGAISDVIDSDPDIIPLTQIPSFVPFFSPEEIEDLGAYGEKNYYSDDYRSGYDPNVSKEIVSKFYNELDFSTQNISDYFHTIQNLVSEYKSYGRNEIKQELLELGWNPEIINSSSISSKHIELVRERYANYWRDRMCDIVDVANMKGDSILSESKKNGDLLPVYVILVYTGTVFGKAIRRVTRGTYSHAAIGFEPDLKHMYSFNADKKVSKSGGGMSFESIDGYKKNASKDSVILVSVVFVNKEQYRKIRYNIDYYIANYKKTKYDFRNIANILTNKSISGSLRLSMICSQFVDNILKLANIDIADGKSSNLITPNDLAVSKNPKIYHIYEGPLVDYDEKEVKRKVDSLVINNPFVPIDESQLDLVDDIFKCTNIYELKQKVYSISESKSRDIILDKLTPISILIEVTTPIEFNDKGDLILSLKKNINKWDVDDFEKEFGDTHRLLTEYDKTSNMDAMKYEICKLWYMNQYLEKLIRKLSKKEAKSFIDTRARILNDFTKYLNKINKEDKSFNFHSYYKSSPFDNESLKINRSTLKYSGKAIRSLSKLLK